MSETTHTVWIEEAMVDPRSPVASTLALIAIAVELRGLNARLDSLTRVGADGTPHHLVVGD